MPTSFELSTANKIFIGLVGALFTLWVVLASNHNPDAAAFNIGRLLGKGLVIVGIPYALGLARWRASGRKEGAGNKTFALLLTFMLFSQLASLGRNRQEQKAQGQFLNRLESLAGDLTQDLETAEDLEEKALVYDKYREEVATSLEDLGAGSDGNEKEILGILTAMSKEDDAKGTLWMAALDAVLDDRLLNLERLREEGEFEFQQGVLQTYAEATRVYRDYTLTAIAELELKLVPFARDEFAKGVLRGAEKSHNEKLPTLEPLFNSHLDSAKSMSMLLNLLEDNPDSWHVVDGEIELYGDEMFDMYNELQEQMNLAAETIEAMSAQYFETF